MRTVRRAHPVLIHGSVASPDCLCCVIELPPSGADFATRWQLLKAGFSMRLPATARRLATAMLGTRDPRRT
ncbi:hypothetical protein [Immundisolibacter sp.]